MFMWIAGRQRPDFRTINRFRSERMKVVPETVFTGLLPFLAEEKYVQLEHYFVDGTKIETSVNRYTFVWGTAVVKQKAKLQEKVQTLFATIEAAEKQEQAGQDLDELGGASTRTLDTAGKKIMLTWKVKNWKH